MAKQQANSRGQQAAAQPAKAAPIRATKVQKDSIFSEGKGVFIFGRQHFILFGIGLALVLAGLALMTGGQQPDPNEWDPNIIYSPMRITVAPLMMVAGFIVVIMGIFKKTPAAEA